MKLEHATTRVALPDDGHDPIRSIRPSLRLEGPPVGAAPTQSEPTRKALVGEGSMPRISIDFGDVAPRTRRPGADLEVQGILGEGGMGRVLLARQHSLSRDVALKVLRESATASDAAALMEEGSIVGRLEHPGIVPMHALGLDHRDFPVLVMKRIDGITFRELLDDREHPAWDGRRKLEQLAHALDVLAAVSSAAHFAHDQGIVHLDIKGENVLLGSHGEVYLVDWGLARAIVDEAPTSRSFAGTPAFAAPEMVLGGPLDPRTDVYLLGSLLHVVLTGRPRHPGRTVRQVLDAAKRSEPPAFGPDVPHALADLVLRATATDPKDRPPTADAFRRDLERFLHHRTSATLCSEAWRRLDRLEALIDDEEETATSERGRAIDALAVEAGFALEQAQEAWPSNPEAADGRARLDAIVELRRNRLAALQAQARQLDVRHFAGQRRRTITAIIAIGLTASAVGIVSAFSGAPRSTSSLTVESAIIALVATTLVGAYRRPLRESQPNRAAATAVLCISWGIFASRLAGFLTQESAPVLLGRDLLLCAMVAGMLSVILSRAYLPVSVVLTATAFFCFAWPESAELFFAVSTGGGLIATGLIERHLTIRAGGAP